MENLKISFGDIFNRFKKIILIILIGISGLLLTLTGLGLIQLTQPLILYSGIALLVMTGLIYLFM